MPFANSFIKFKFIIERKFLQKPQRFRAMSQYLLNVRYSFSQVRKLVIIRHGQSIWNKQKKWAGWSDIRLSQKGVNEAKQCGKLLKQNGFFFDKAYCSMLTRSIQTLNYILDEMDLHYIPVKKQWRLNQKHYGSLTGQSKRQVTEKYGQKQVADWRRSFDVAPPPVDVNDKRHPSKDRRYAQIDPSQLPCSENQNDVIRRLNPLWENQIKRDIISGENVFISAHGGSARALVKIISNLSNQQIMQLNLPHATPLVYSFEVHGKNDLKVINREYLGDLDQIKAKMEKVKNETKLNPK